MTITYFSGQTVILFIIQDVFYLNKSGAGHEDNIDNFEGSTIALKALPNNHFLMILKNHFNG